MLVKRALRKAGLAFCLLALGCASDGRFVNLTVSKDELRVYHDSGEYMAAFESVADRAMRAIEERVRRSRPGERLALVLDIDETSLSNWPYLERYDFARNAALFGSWARQSACPALPPTLRLYRTARRLGVAVFFITGRREPLRTATAANLQRQGFGSYAGLDLRPLDDHESSVVPFKSSRRREIESRGYTIVLNLGDQWSDLEGGNAEETFKLPNPFYLIR